MILAEGTFHHVYDFYEFELPFGIKLPLPHVGENPAVGYGLTKFMILQVVAVLLVMFVFRGLASRVEGGRTVNGWFWNFWEMLAMHIRDGVVRPVIGDPSAHGHDIDGHEEAGNEHDSTIGILTPSPLAHDHHHGHSHGHGHGKDVHVGHPADKYLPWVWSAFFYILFCNLLGALPWLGSATGDLNVTLALALCAFIATFVYGARQHGGGAGFFTHMIPKIDAPPLLKAPITYGIFAIEVIGLFIKHGVLSVRLFANIMGGHTVLGVILGFILMILQNAPGLWPVVTPASLLGQVGIGLLELLVAFIQAYVFSFLSTIFIAMSLHEH
jgi:F-type H+-transporting ATPase subunit a